MKYEEVSKILLFGQACGAACVGAIGTTAGVTKERVNKILYEQGKDLMNKTLIEGF